MGVSNYLLEKLGFRRLSSDETIARVFYSAHIYAVRGFTTDAGALDPLEGRIDDVTYRLAVGKSINQIVISLVGEKMADDEKKWQEENKCLPPYLVVILGPTKEYIVKETYIKDDDEEFATYDSFSDAKKELKELEEHVLPRFLTILDINFSDIIPPIKLIKICKHVYGKTKNGRLFKDIKLEMSATLYGSQPMKENEIKIYLEKSIKDSNLIDKKTANFYFLGLNESDTLKKFLYFFLFTEIKTHKTFESIDHEAHLSQLIAPQERLSTSLQSLFSKQRDSWRSLGDRFVWCAACVWKDLSDDDIKQFKKLKDQRDAIAHGRISVPEASAVDAVKKLATKLGCYPDLRHSPRQEPE